MTGEASVAVSVRVESSWPTMPARDPLSRWSHVLIQLWLHRLGIDILMGGKLASCIPMARRFLESSESEDERDRDEEEDEGGGCTYRARPP